MSAPKPGKQQAPPPQPEPSQEEKSDEKNDDFVAEGEDAQEKGYWGTRKSEFKDEEYALTTGPNSPVTDAKGRGLGISADEHIEKQPKEQ